MNWADQYKKELLSSNNSYGKISEFVISHLPSRLYKYGSFNSEYWKKTIFNGQIYLANADVFNDPFDCLVNFDIDKLLSSDYFKYNLKLRYPMLRNEKFWKDVRSEKNKIDLLEEIKKDLRVSCFSETWDSVLMWSHYADSHKGFCIEYDTSKLSDIKRHMLFPVLYQEDIVDITEDLINHSSKVGLISMISKAKDWTYEKEWRMISLKESGQNSYYFRKEIKAIILGLRCEEKNRNKICEWASDKNVRVFQTTISSFKYGIRKEKII